MHEMSDKVPSTERPDAFWHRVYFAVVIVTVVVIGALWVFSKYFST
ncbi:MAG: hypothetical protein IT173_10100 [Acidobacteria bacterium]|nr:hypothetical protein [Acidobacteriota bacterium]